MDGYKEELPRLQEPEDEDCYILSVQSSSDDTNGSSVARRAPRRRVSCILNVRSRSGDTNGSSVARRAPKRQASSVVVIDSDSDEEFHTYEEKKAKLLEINSNDESPECCHVKPVIQEPPIVISDDDNDDDNGNDVEVLYDNSNDLKAPDDNSDDSDVPNDSSDDSDVSDDSSGDSDVSDDSRDDSDVSDDSSADSDVSDDSSDDSDVPDNSDDSDVTDDNSDDSDVPDNKSDDLEAPDNNSNDLEVPVPAEDLCNEGQIASDEEELDEAAAAVSQHHSSDDAGEQDLGENLSEPPSDPEANLEVSERKLPTEEEPAPVVEQSGKRKSKPKTNVEPLRKRQTKTENIVESLRKRKAKTKNVSVTPGHKKCGPSKKKPGAAKVGKRKTRTPKCKVPGCFLHDLEKSKKYSGKNLKRNKNELVRRIYDLFNRSVCDKKLPEKLRIGWNNKMVKTAGLCSTGEMWYPKRRRFAKIQIGLKVCNSADRIRDTLIHELCHAASWLIDGIRDSHGDAWKYYARKSNKIHPELPRVTRCHNYKINYKVHYECTGCKTRIGCYTKSLDTSRFICAKCEGSLVMVPLTQKDGTRIVPHV
ncbi:germ cell nuclear acidic protein [Symphalangus syndactylus]|uniref:germ cell nuclear acidic protein n=1 Tax=Symphalangus syndactylus TaxID=9590 RepID=UPI0024427575|nr:germ cell nuclear acidic protein isoform X1 [Symphalangus syndactylus]XP_055124520.1 germ cell nuclear acidic protein isoform X1 [Symphalangus syndactylus]